MARKTPEFNASSMADIAFLLLIFFLVTTTMDVTTGINRKLPPPPDPTVKPPDIKDRNIMNILVSKSDRLLVNGKPGQLEDLKEDVIKFMTPHYPDDVAFPEVKEETIDLIGTVYKSRGIISLKNDRGTSYDMYIQVQDKIAQAFTQLKDELSDKKFGRKYADLNEDEAKAINEAVPVPVSEAEPEDVGTK
ncbi:MULTISPECIES: biopolymer transporter ExbD [unclassified Lentimicrobium]|uniref:ExbD/TolR family protein n=1 Tax=unclassified Lentimicrobium TaxID=2677434 RepID=UPI0015519DAE|nr:MULTISPECIES: biopolymer transporter ExbD [unclassified Lentimicrobium]NPD47201.1 biopolymer transporter ExbD [Lentimicrobium sp. S6]NPD84876.1 biopolymer transporter ExbD [Lentimicrobium sp. L6]